MCPSAVPVDLDRIGFVRHGGCLQRGEDVLKFRVGKPVVGLGGFGEPRLMVGVGRRAVEAKAQGVGRGLDDRAGNRERPRRRLDDGVCLCARRVGGLL